MRPNELRAERARIATNAQAVYTAIAAPTAEDNATFDAALAEVDRLQAQIERAERAETLTAELAVQQRQTADEQHISADQVADNVRREKRLLVAWLTGNRAGLSAADAEALTRRGELGRGFENAGAIGTAGAGGYTVAPDFMRELLIAEKAFGGMRAAARVLSTDTGVDLPWPTMDDTANVATIVGENTAGAAGTDLAFGSKTLKCWTYRSGYLPISIELLQDSAFDFDSLIRNALAIRFARGQNAHFTGGNGTTQPQGIALAASAAVGKQGIAGQTVTVITDDLVDLEHSIDPAYRPGSIFMMHDTTVQALRKMKDSTGRPLWQVQDDPAMAGTAGATINGYRYVVNQDMPVMAASALSIAFGNFQNYIIRDVLGLRVTRLNERFAENGQIAFIAFQRTDGRLVSAGAPLKFYKNSAT
jgi:HK97 family phage major capsid protein